MYFESDSTLCVSWTDCGGDVASSKRSRTTLWPLIPWWALISATAFFAAALSGPPTKTYGPVSGAIIAMWMSAAVLWLVNPVETATTATAAASVRSATPNLILLILPPPASQHRREHFPAQQLDRPVRIRPQAARERDR